MTTEEQMKLVDRINVYADKVLKDIDPQKTKISYQLDKLKPEMEKIAQENNMTLEEIFIMYMDLNSTYTKKKQEEFMVEMDENK